MSEPHSARKLRSRSLLPKKLQDFLILQIFYVARVFIRAAVFLNEPSARKLVRILYRPASRFNRRLCKRNLEAFFPAPHHGAERRERLYRDFLEYMVRFQEETARCFFIPPANLESKVWLNGEAHLREALKKGRGALIVSGHMGTWWHVPCLLAARGYKLNVVFNSFPFPPIEDYLRRSAARYGIQLTFVDKGVPRMMQRAAEKNEIVYLTFDVAVRQHHSNWQRFGATKININPGPAILALRCRIPVIYASTFHGDPQRSHVTLHPPTFSDAAAGMRANDLCQSWVERLHSEILQHPEQWWGWGFSDLPRVRKAVAKDSSVPTPDAATATKSVSST